MKKIILSLALALTFVSYDAIAQSKNANPVKVAIDLETVKEDKVMVTVLVPKVKTQKIVYHLPKTVPGTYSTDNYGKYIDDLKAFDAKGNALTVSKPDENSWEIDNAKKLSKITYLVNDTFDTEKPGTGFGGGNVFSPAGTNIDEGKNYMINMHGFVGYFNEFNAAPYHVTITHPKTIWGATSMTDTDPSEVKDVFVTSRYAELVEHPIMYSKPDYTTFNVSGMEIVIAVYSPTGAYTAESITPEMKTIMTAQKNFLGKFNATKKYCVLLYLSTMSPTDAKGFGALEHPTSTTVVMPEMIPKDQMVESMKDVVSHEFFHIVTPLTIHSKEIHDFDYNNPKMSQHLWMYEGVTEYFANLFQVNQGLISEEDFYKRMADKIESAAKMNDTMPFTTMSANVLVEPYKSQYLNVYQKGALIGMCIDIIIREKSNGERGILDLMQKLSAIYGVNKAFDDKELFAKITELSYPEVGAFLSTYVSGSTPIPYDAYFAKVGVTKTKVKTAGGIFLKDQTPYITVNQSKEISVIPGIELNDFYTTLGIKNGDVIVEINDKKYNLDNIYEMITVSQSWKEGDAITIKIKRDGKEQLIKGNVKVPYIEKDGFIATDTTKENLKNAWLKK
ncbi:MAG TPA: peptidase M61 [Flavobacterium sp.]|jgi:predicted metalloprotease with PDZ domain